MVKRCVRKVDGKEFAVKVMDRSKMDEEDLLALQSEVDILSSVRSRALELPWPMVHSPSPAAEAPSHHRF